MYVCVHVSGCKHNNMNCFLFGSGTVITSSAVCTTVLRHSLSPALMLTSDPAIIILRAVRDCLFDEIPVDNTVYVSWNFRGFEKPSLAQPRILDI